MPNTTPATAWKALNEGNERFVAGKPEHPDQDVDRRKSLTSGQQPIAAVFGCSDSRVPAELVFDQGLGDIFVVRTAGQAIDAAVLGSLEYAVAVLNVPLLVVLGHRSCGAVKATVGAVQEGSVPAGFIRDVVERVAPSILVGRKDGLSSPEEFEDRHVSETVAQLVARSAIIAERVEQGTLGIVGAIYHLSDGRAAPVERAGKVAETV
ncbi:carbonic anhydrase [Mycobacterium sp. 1423905.2]|uniref:carbonic anhydrase n=1 Tax=Mycobacterium sp. 1423905.2 TaxID=1856859 RepID=UPI00080230A0|nr:carbonic anhydrase [Mycobacterium sp. 1423905.2]OBJ47241.1 carbonic anhydrase [Mycobacterium sp. 1423905.2]